MFGSGFIKKLGVLATATSYWSQNILAPPTSSNLSTSIDGNPFPPLIEATLDDLVWGLDTGLFTSVDLVNAYTARIKEVNPALHAVNELNPDAADIAAELDAERASGALRGPLHGIPILIKDNIATDDKMNNTAGSYALLGSRVPRDSTVASKLRKAGAIILGKTNLSQWANYRSENTSNGWSAYGGQTKGAYYPGQDPSGSSSGSGVASSLGLALGALGTETGGSIISPSDHNNLVGIKPTVGLTSRYLVVPISEHQDTVGPMTRTVKDGASLLSAIAGADPRDNYTSAIPFDSTPNYVEACKLDALQGKRIGVLRDTNISSEPAVSAFATALEVLRDAGATVIENITLPGLEAARQSKSSLVVLQADFNTALAKYVAELTVNPHDIHSVSDLRDFTRGFSLEGYPARNTERWDGSIALGFGNDAPGFWPYYMENMLYGGPLGITGALRNLSLDALVVPARFTSELASLIGSPIITVPLGKYPEGTTVTQNKFGDLNATGPNFPYGFSFLGDHFDEFNLIGLAYAFEQRTLVRNTVVPYTQPTTELVDVVRSRKMEAEL
ncbi:hypothetical protein VM1G_06176 [Cytospora mali]|uniref:Amidase domain-containing protein n=1 Tax=Cytospora mali TaxID=578113 RepID=A0A194W192_CYTMA|nr:hypothetical protein VM1G_06176 [Valsa mali]